MEAMSFKGQSILVTGASSGLGKEIATCLARDYGANLVISARREDRLQELADDLTKKYSVSVEVCAADLGLEADVDKLFEFCTSDRNLYGAILNAGITHFGKWDELDFEGFLKMQAVNNTCVVKLASALLPYFEKRAVGGGLMFVASQAGVTPVPYQTFYSATKAFLVHLGAGLHYEMKPRGVSVTTFVPGGIDTEMTEGSRFNDLRSFLMPVGPCAREGVNAFRTRKYMHSPGLMYKVGGVLSKLLPGQLVVSTVAAQYKRSLEANR